MRKRIALMFAVAVIFATEPGVAVGANATTSRIAGPDRYATAAAIALSTYPEPGDAYAVVLVRGDDPADALAASTLASVDSAPILLTTTNQLHSEARKAIDALDVRLVNIMGGPVAVSPAVESELRELGLEVVRYAGENRFDTARKVTSACIFECSFGMVGGELTAFLANGYAPVDAVGAGAIAYNRRLPMLFSHRDSVPPETFSAIEETGVTQIIVVGGTAVVSESVVQQLEERGLSVRRIAGTTRQETAAAIATFARDELMWIPENVDLTRGDVIFDGLAASPHAGRMESPLLLTESPTKLGSAARDFLADNKIAAQSIVALGSEAAVSDAVLADAQEATSVP